MDRRSHLSSGTYGTDPFAITTAGRIGVLGGSISLGPFIILIAGQATESREDPFEKIDVGATIEVIALVNANQSIRGHVRDEYPSHTERHAQNGGNLRYRAEILTELKNFLFLWR